ncbi:MAG: hypothetical protein ABFQ65_01860 [Nanoarchaeota archaeon]
MSQEQKDQHIQELEYEIAEVNMHSYEVNLGQARELARQEALGWRHKC